MSESRKPHSTPDHHENARRVVIVGCGFGGLAAAKHLSRDPRLHVTVIDRRNHHLFQPLLYQVATAGLSPADIASPIRSLLRATNTRVLLGEVESVDFNTKTVSLKSNTLPYDLLILACGVRDSYFGKDAWEIHAPGLKSLEQATEIRRRILIAFEIAERETNPQIQREYQTFVIVGGGPTGVELAGAIAEISRYTLSRDFKTITPNSTRVILVEAGSRILSGFSESLSKRAARDLEKLGVQIWTSSRVTDITSEGVSLGQESIRARTVLWAAGVRGVALNQKLRAETDSAGRLRVDEYLNLPGYPDVFCIGDQMTLSQDGHPLPGIAPVAMQQGRYVAEQVIRRLDQKNPLPFRYRDTGIMATIGRKAAVVQIGRFWLTGFWAWVFWLSVHIFFLIGFKNRFFVFWQWAWSYFTFKRGARLIVGK